MAQAGSVEQSNTVGSCHKPVVLSKTTLLVHAQAGSVEQDNTVGLLLIGSDGYDNTAGLLLTSSDVPFTFYCFIIFFCGIRFCFIYAT